MKKLLIVLLVVGMLIGAGGCTMLVPTIITYALIGGSVALTTEVLAPDLEEPEE